MTLALRGCRVGLTGGLPSLTRQAFKERLAAVGALYVVRVEDGIDVLVVGGSPLASKIGAAREAGAEVVDWVVFEERLDAPIPADLPLADAPLKGPPSVRVDEATTRILDLVLPRRPAGPHTPSVASFQDHVVDAPTARLLRGLARAAVLGQPCLVEGETSTAKTSSIRFLAALVGANVVRLNLNGQTDTGELVGRYVPDGSGWRFAEGLVPTAMRNGWWVVLDEVNLAEPAVLERLNPCLERVPELTLTEGPGTRFGPAGDVPVHPDFRVFATMNPAAYAGRSVLSEAWRDRFVSHLSAERPTERDLLHLVEHACTGHHPAIEHDGVEWAAAALSGAPRPGLDHAVLQPLLPRLAPLFAGLLAMTQVVAGGEAPLGVDRRERYVFSRRGLLAVLDAVGTLTRYDPVADRIVDAATDPVGALHEAVHAATVARMHDEVDRARVGLLVRSLGL